MFPIMVDAADQKIAIVGGGPIALHKVENVNRFGIVPDVIAPDIHPDIWALAERGLAVVHQKPVEWVDLADAFIIMLVTDNPDVNRTMAERARAQQKIVVHAEQTDLGNAQIPAVLKRGRLLISVSTSGASPSLSTHIRNRLEEEFDERYEDYVEFLYEARQYIKKHVQERPERRHWLKKAVEARYLDYPDEREHYMADLYSRYPAL